MSKFIVKDTVKYARQWIVEADNEDDAIKSVEGSWDWSALDYSFREIETSGYEATVFAEPDIFRCKACDRPELECSADPCPAVVLDRES
jgi:hypothetical protein